ncbi:RagB/SusD family nutrient uptake outer membrane protein [Sphingobacterium sp. ML3W]|uniref:RagB/SusD family nutrient uptake outer membrane protein n=1 Tax=Sphingobacterium sp. ML3W TaxID=1538644 RepID=UPI00249BACB7|nr:RagB/SusD family nutrient uptake outer membrane protein [Sphingobacterium sp. ML3W]WFA81025.1 RagB/SusD family nutrient uptake outer membrane protein [Sphingobacterium sp. ML3W]
MGLFQSKIFKFIFVVWTIFLFHSCKSGMLDPANPGAITSDDVWKDTKLIEAYVAGMYQDVPGWDYNLYNNITDEARSNYPGQAPNNVLVGEWDETNCPMDNWAGSYQRIRRINELLARIDGSPVPADRKSSIKGEAYFLRALHYFGLAKRYGGVPIISQAQTLSEDLLVKRNSIKETFDFIVDDLENAYAMLPTDVSPSKASKWAAKGLQARALLFAASPLFNTTNDPTLWSKSAAASKLIIESGKFTLHQNLKTLWQVVNKESLFEVQYKMPEKYHGLDALVKPLRLANNDAGQCSPTQELVDAFPMANGKRITEAGSGYNAQNPYVGRDQRFYAAIAYNGSKMKGTTSGPPLKEITLETFKGGQDFDANPATKIYNTITGYYRIKSVNQENTLYSYGYGSTQPWIELRYAEVLLNYAEAQNEALSNPDASVYIAINTIRNRAGISSNIPQGSLTKEQMRELIRNERYVELCFEEKRYFDLRRWKVATSVLHGKKGTGVFITKNADGTFTFQYLAIDPNPIVFTEKMYFIPIPFSETSKNANLLPNNPGWQ